jgi:hypothetical protein
MTVVDADRRTIRTFCGWPLSITLMDIEIFVEQRAPGTATAAVLSGWIVTAVFLSQYL